MKYFAVLAVFMCTTAICVTPTSAQFDFNSISSVLEQMPTKDKINLLVSFIANPDNPVIFNKLENIFLVGYSLFHEEPTFRPEILHNLVQWSLDELPFLVRNQTFKDSVHIFIQEINTANLSIVNTTNEYTFVNGIFDQMNWIHIVLQIGSKILEPWFIKHGMDKNITVAMIPLILKKAERLVSYLPSLLPQLIGQLNKMGLQMQPSPTFQASTQKVNPTNIHASLTTQTSVPSIVSVLQNSNDISMKAMLIYNYFLNNTALFSKMEHILLSAIPLLTEPPTLRTEIFQRLLPWALDSLPDLLRSETFKKGFHVFINEINTANTTGLNVTNEYEFMHEVFNQINWLRTIRQIVSEIAVPISINIGITPTIVNQIIPQLLTDIESLLKHNGQNLLVTIISSMNKANKSLLNYEIYTDDIISNFFQQILFSKLLPDMLSTPSLRNILSPILSTVQNIIISAFPVLQELGNMRPEISNVFLPWALKQIPQWLQSPTLKHAIQTIVNEVNKVNTTRLNMTSGDAFINDVIAKMDLLHIVGNISRPIVLKLAINAGLKPELATYLVPFILQHLEKVAKNDLVNFLKLFINEMNNVNIRDLNSKDPTEFIRILDVRKLISGILMQPTIKSFLISSLIKSPQIILDLGKILLSSFHVGDILTLPVPHVASKECYDDTIGFIVNLLSGTDWAIKMFDAFGKPPTGSLTGNLHFIGSYDECLALNGRHFPGVNSSSVRYCRTTFKLSENLVNKTVGHINTFGVPLSLTWGMCVFSRCHSKDIPTLFKLGFLEQFDLKPNSVVCSDEKSEFSKDAPAVAITAIMAAMIGLVILATVIHGITRAAPQSTYHNDTNERKHTEYTNKAFDISLENGSTPKPFNYLSNSITKRKVDETKKVEKKVEQMDEIDQDEEGIGRRILASFSLFTNMRSVLSFDRNPDDVACLHGIRFFSILFITVGNAYLFSATWPAISESTVIANGLSALDVIKRFSFQMVVSSTLETDTFLMLSGFIITYKLLTSIAKEEKLKVITLLAFVIRRFIRLTPVYAVVMMSYAFLYSYVGDGPTWPKNIELAETCRHRWWYHILYVNNLVGTEGKNAFQQCMPWSWFNAVVMQLNIVTPMLIFFFLISNRLGFCLVVLLMAGGMTATGVKEHRYGGDILSSLMDDGNYWNNVFTAPWCRVSSYCVGILLAFVLFLRRRNEFDVLWAVVGWITSILVGVFLIFVTYLKYMENAPTWTLPEQAAYESLCRPVWSACIAWIIFACHNYRGGVFNTIFSWRGFIPLSRLTYIIYLLNPVVIAVYVMSRKTLMYVDDIDMIFLMISYFVVTVMGAAFLSVFFERPFMSLEKALVKKSKAEIDWEKDSQGQ